MSMYALYGELAAGLVRALIFPQLDAIAGASLDDCSSSALGAASSMLPKLQVAQHHVALEAGRVGVCTTLAIDTSRLAKFFSDLPLATHSTLPPIDEVLAAWLSSAEHRQWLSVRREPFVPDDVVKTCFAELVEQGYATASGDAVMWTNKIGPAMRLSNSWDENHLSFAEREEFEAEQMARQAYASIPDDVRIAALQGNVVAVSKALAARWNDGTWLTETEELPWWKLGEGGRCAKRLIELVRADTGLLTQIIN